MERADAGHIRGEDAADPTSRGISLNKSIKDEIGKYKIIGLQRTGDGSKREERPKLFYPIYG